MTYDQNLVQLIELAKREDLGAGDLTTNLMGKRDEPVEFRLLAKERGVFAGRDIALPVLHAYDEAIELAWTNLGCDGGRIDSPPAHLATVLGPWGKILSAERVLLNFLQRLSGVATLTRRFVDAVAGTDTAIYDTRKTTPGWRMLEKYAVRCGGGHNHRQGLDDAVLIKDNHLAGVSPGQLAATVFEMLDRLPEGAERPAFVEVEVGSLTQVEELFTVAGIDVILLDNFSPEDLGRAVALREERGLRGKIALEASGGITLETVRAVAMTGVDRISTGAITHSATAIDLAMERV